MKFVCKTGFNNFANNGVPPDNYGTRKSQKADNPRLSLINQDYDLDKLGLGP